MADELCNCAIDCEIVDESSIATTLQSESNVYSSEVTNVVIARDDYTGVDNNLIKVVVDNEDDTIEAVSKTYIFEQAIASTTWNINHNLNKYPSVTVIDSGGDQVMTDVNYVDKNNITLQFGAGFSGKAYLN